MKVEFDFDRCILCTENPADSWEHIIPDIIGGRLQARVLCSHCNNNLGSKMISKVKNDPSIRLAVRNLKEEMPKLFEKIENDQIYNTKSKNDTSVKSRYKNSKFEIIAHQKEDGSLILDTKKGIKNIVQMLRKEGLSEHKIASKIRSFKKLEDNKIVQLSKTVKVVKWSIESTFPYLQGSILDEKVIVLIAFEFLSLLIGNLIYNDRFDFIREFIQKGEKSRKLIIEHLTSGKYSPYHKIYPELLETEIIINIVFFRWLVYKVHIKGFRLLSTPDFVYLEDLKSRKTLIAKSVDQAKQGVYCGA